MCCNYKEARAVCVDQAKPLANPYCGDEVNIVKLKDFENAKEPAGCWCLLTGNKSLGMHISPVDRFLFWISLTIA